MAASPRLRVAVVDPASWSLSYDVPLATALAKRGLDVTLHCARSPHVGLPTTSEPGLTIRESFYRGRPPRLPRRMWRAVNHPVDLLQLVRALRRDADAVIVQWLPARGLDARLWRWLSGHIPVVLVAHNAQERDNVLPLRWLQSFTAVIAHSASGAAALRARGVETVWHIGIGSYDQYAALADPDPLPVRLDPSTPVAVFVGLLRAYKGIDLLLSAWPEVQRRVPAAHLVIAGRPVDVTLPATLPAGVTALPRFLTEAEMGWLLRRADVCALPYRAIDMSGVAASAMACATPIVATDVGGLGELAGNGALIVAADDVGALAAALTLVLADHAVRDKLRGEMRAAVAGAYSWDVIAAQWHAHVASAVSMSRMPRAPSVPSVPSVPSAESDPR